MCAYDVSYSIYASKKNSRRKTAYNGNNYLLHIIFDEIWYYATHFRMSLLGGTLMMYMMLVKTVMVEMIHTIRDLGLPVSERLSTVTPQ